MMETTPLQLCGRITWNVSRANSDHRSNRNFLHAMLVERDDREIAPLEESHMVCSRLPNGRHMPVIDLDGPHQLVPSSTAGHSHLYLDNEIPWWRYVILLFALRQAGVIEKGFLWWSLSRGSTFARLPGVGKDASIGIRKKETS